MTQCKLKPFLDSGFTDYLTLPTTIIARLESSLFVDTTECQLADGRIVSMQSYLATIRMARRARRDILVLAADGQPLSRHGAALRITSYHGCCSRRRTPN